MSADWIRYREPKEKPLPSAEDVRREKMLKERITELRGRASGLVDDFDRVGAPVVQRATEEGMVSAAASLLEELTVEARKALGKFEAEVDALLASDEKPVTEQVPTVPVPPSAAIAEASSVSVISPASERPLPPVEDDVARGVAQHIGLVVDELDAAADAAGAAEDNEGTGIVRLFSRLKDLEVSQWPIVNRLLRKRKSAGTMMQLGVLLPTLLFGGASHTEAREAQERSAESATQGFPKTDRTYKEEEIREHPEMAQEIFQKFYFQWQQLQHGESIPQTNERYVMPPFVFMKIIEPVGLDAEQKYAPQFIVQLVEKDIDKHGRLISDNLVGRQPVVLKTEDDWKRITILMEQFLNPNPPFLTVEERAILVTSAERHRELYGDPVSEQDPRIAFVDNGRTYRTDDADDTDAPRRRHRRMTASSRPQQPRRPTTGPTGLPRYTIGSGVTRQFEPAHVPDAAEQRDITLRLMEATFGPLQRMDDDYQPRGRTIELGEHTHDATPATDVPVDEADGTVLADHIPPPPPSSEPTAGKETGVDFSTREAEQVIPEDRERMHSVTTYFATIFDPSRSLSDRRVALQDLLKEHGTSTSGGGQEYRLDHFLFSMHGNILTVDIQLPDGTTRTFDLSSAEVWSEFDRQAETM